MIVLPPHHENYAKEGQTLQEEAFLLPESRNRRVKKIFADT
jgi:hypothetical protein